jgi:hypothetical protein
MHASSPFEPERLVDALNAAQVRYVIVGGLAAGAHGVVRATRDLDLVPDPECENMDRLARVLVDFGGVHPVQDALSGDSLARPASMKVETNAGEVHVLNRMPGTPPFDDLWSGAIRVEVDPGIEAPVCSLEHLRRMKRASNRPRDAVDLVELDELHGPE